MEFGSYAMMPHAQYRAEMDIVSSILFIEQTFPNFGDICENKIVKFSQLPMSCRNFHKQSCQLCENKSVKFCPIANL